MPEVSFGAITAGQEPHLQCTVPRCGTQADRAAICKACREVEFCCDRHLRYAMTRYAQAELRSSLVGMASHWHMGCCGTPVGHFADSLEVVRL